MAFSNTYDTTNPGSAVSNRESLVSELTILAPEETPILSMAPKGKATNMKHEWTVDILDAPNATPIEEGADVSSFTDKFAGRARLYNNCQIFRRDWRVSVQQAATDSVGPASTANAEIKARQELKRDIELALAADNDQVAGASGTAPELRGLGDWIDSAGPSDVPADYRTPSDSIDANGTAITESQFNAVIDSMYNQNGQINRITGIFATALRRTISDFTRAVGTIGTTDEGGRTYHVTQAADSKKITLAVNLYDSDHGVVSLVTGNPVCMPATDRGYFLNTSLYGVDSLVPMRSVRLEDEGGGERGFCDCTLTLRCKSPLGHGKIT